MTLPPLPAQTRPSQEHMTTSDLAGEAILEIPGWNAPEMKIGVLDVSLTVMA
jgi:hypothetical protein